MCVCLHASYKFCHSVLVCVSLLPIVSGELGTEILLALKHESNNLHLLSS